MAQSCSILYPCASAFTSSECLLVTNSFMARKRSSPSVNYNRNRKKALLIPALCNWHFCWFMSHIVYCIPLLDNMKLVIIIHWIISRWLCVCLFRMPWCTYYFTLEPLAALSSDNIFVLMKKCCVYTL